jgi:NADH dehydrogenase [ubiquinone] 1 alpha subcomplex assembly factor 6
MFPIEKRRAFYAIRAFNCEVAMIKDQANANAMTARIRFQWWTDQLEELYAHKQLDAAHPVVSELKLAVDEFSLTKRWFERCLEARQRDIHSVQIGTMCDLEDYAEFAHSSIIYLLLEIMTVREDLADYAASHVGVCCGITTLLRGTAYHSAGGSIYIPNEVMDKFGLSSHTLLHGPADATQRKALEESVFDVASQANAHLEKARQLVSDGLPNGSIHALLPGVSSSLLLEKLREANFNPFDSQFVEAQNPLRLQLSLLRARLLSRV